MPSKIHVELHGCPFCEGKGRLASRLPFRTKPCDESGCRGVIALVQRQRLLAKMKARRERQ
jgi:hypothetical protein